MAWDAARIPRSRKGRPDVHQALSCAYLRPDHLERHAQHSGTDDPRTKRLYKDEPVKVYNFFADEFFGIERTIAQIVRYFHSASLKGEESRQVLYLMGPVGSGKSSLVERVQRGLEQADAGLRHRGLPDARGAAASDPAPSAARVREDARRAHRGRPVPGLPLPAQGGVRPALRGISDQDAQLLQAQPASASAWCRRSIRTTRTPRC